MSASCGWMRREGARLRVRGGRRGGYAVIRVAAAARSRRVRVALAAMRASARAANSAIAGHGVSSERLDVPYEVIEHDATFSAAAEAHAVGAELEATAKTVAVHYRDGYRLAVIPACERLDVRRARDILGASHHLRLATEEELQQEFPAFELGALPPFGTAPLPELVDLRLLRHERVLCAAGEKRRSVLIAALDLLRVTEPRVADICEHPEEREPPGKLPSR